MVTIDLTHFPPHVQNLGNFAWKACIIRHSAESLPCFLFLDAGMELRDSIADIKSKVANHSNWFVTASNGRGFSTLAGVVHPGAPCRQARPFDSHLAPCARAILLPQRQLPPCTPSDIQTREHTDAFANEPIETRIETRIQTHR
jgi:hypothetical protein